MENNLKKFYLVISSGKAKVKAPDFSPVLQYVSLRRSLF